MILRREVLKQNEAATTLSYFSDITCGLGSSFLRQGTQTTSEEEEREENIEGKESDGGSGGAKGGGGELLYKGLRFSDTIAIGNGSSYQYPKAMFIGDRQIYPPIIGSNLFRLRGDGATNGVMFLEADDSIMNLTLVPGLCDEAYVFPRVLTVAYKFSDNGTNYSKNIPSFDPSTQSNASQYAYFRGRTVVIRDPALNFSLQDAPSVVHTNINDVRPWSVSVSVNGTERDTLRTEFQTTNMPLAYTKISETRKRILRRQCTIDTQCTLETTHIPSSGTPVKHYDFYYHGVKYDPTSGSVVISMMPTSQYAESLSLSELIVTPDEFSYNLVCNNPNSNFTFELNSNLSANWQSLLVNVFLVEIPSESYVTSNNGLRVSTAKRYNQKLYGSPSNDELNMSRVARIDIDANSSAMGQPVFAWNGHEISLGHAQFGPFNLTTTENSRCRNNPAFSLSPIWFGGLQQSDGHVVYAYTCDSIFGSGNTSCDFANVNWEYDEANRVITLNTISRSAGLQYVAHNPANEQTGAYTYFEVCADILQFVGSANGQNSMGSVKLSGGRMMSEYPIAAKVVRESVTQECWITEYNN